MTFEYYNLVTWNLAVKALGAVKASVYIYMVPVIMVVTSVLILKEPAIRTEEQLSEHTEWEILQRTGGLKDGFTVTE